MDGPTRENALGTHQAHQGVIRAKKILTNSAQNRAHFKAKHWRLCARRLAQGLLTPFACWSCGVIALDPLGWNGRGKPLCEACAFGEPVSQPTHKEAA
jgi:hypothetical protein